MTWVLLPHLTRLFISGGLIERNYRGVSLVRGIGVVFPLAWMFSVPFSLGLRILGFQAAALYGMMLFSVCLVGFLDDVFGTKSTKGIRGHFSGLLEGNVSTGVIKAMVIIVTSLPVAAFGSRDLLDLLKNASIIAMSANVYNAFDVKPGRSLKSYWTAMGISFLVMSIQRNTVTTLASGSSLKTHEGLALTLPLVASTLVYGFYDLSERTMMGDAGANGIGASLGFLVIFTFGPELRNVTFLLLLGMQLLIEVTSLSKVVERLRILRFLDTIGTPAKPLLGNKRNSSKQRE